MTALIGGLMATGAVSAIVGDLVGMLCAHNGWLGFGGKVARRIVAARLKRKAENLAARANTLEFLDEAGANQA